MAAVCQALGLAAGSTPTSTQWANLTSLSIDSDRVASLAGLANAVNLQSLTLLPDNYADPRPCRGSAGPVAAFRPHSLEVSHPPRLRTNGARRSVPFPT